MMHSNRQSHRRQHGDRSSRQRDDVDDRWEERREPHRDVPRDPYPKYGGNGHGSAERTNKSREYTDSSKRGYSKDTVGREWSRKSPVRGPTSSPDWGAAEKKRQKFAEGEEDRYRREPEDKKYRQSPDSYSQQEDDFKYRKTSQDSRHRHRHEEFTYRQQHDNDYRQPSGYYKDGDHHENSWDRLEERTRSQESSTKSCGKRRERDDSPSTGHEDHHQNQSWFPLNEPHGGKSFESETTNRSPTVFEPKSTKGFQRFLDVLNKGVNVDTLTKIVTQTSPEVSDGPRSPGSFMTTADSVWCPSSAGRQQGTHQNNHHWSESEGSQRLASPQPHHRSFSPKGCSPSDEKSLQRSDGGQSYYNLKSRSRSPTLVKNITLTPEDEHKQRQMQDVLQAIGMDLGSEELGQMSHRIQERLYGKKDSDRGRQWGGSGERETRRAISPIHRSRSSSSNRSNFSSVTRDNYMKTDSCSARRDVTEVHQTVDYDQNVGCSSLQDSEKRETNSLESSAAFPNFPPSTTYSLSEPSYTPAMPTYSPMNYSPLPYPALPPNMPHVDPRLLLPPYIPYSYSPPLNMSVLTQRSHLLPTSYPQSAFFNLPNVNPLPPLNTAQKAKTQTRPRCLQVIETKQPG